MFDIGFWELAIIAVIALIVVGPEEFPALVRNMTAGIRKIREFISAVKSDMDFEIERVEELKRLVEKEAKLAEMDELAKDLGQSISVSQSKSTQEGRGQNNELDKQGSTENQAKEQSAGSLPGSK